MKLWTGTVFMRIDEIVGVARLLDDAGYHGVLVSDHVAHPRELRSAYPYAPQGDGKPDWDPTTPWPDSWVLIGAMVGATSRLHFSNNVFIAPSRPLLVVAKAVATAAALSGGRVQLGVGAGWMEEEFDLLGARFEDRGRRLDEMIAALRALWQGGWVEWHGEHYDVPEVTLEPAPPGPVPIYCGGHTDAALRRAARLCDGWIGVGYGWDDAAAMVGRLRDHLRAAGREGDPFEVIVGLHEVPSVDTYRRAEEELGITGLMCMPWAGVRPPEGATAEERIAAYRPAIERFAETIVHPLA